MGSGSWSPSAWDKFRVTHTSGKSMSAIFSARGMSSDMNPLNIKMRESRDSADNPKSTPIILALDVTGSMGIIADNLARDGLGTLMTEILNRKPVTDPHIMVMGVGDADFDQAPLQVSQFEADIRIAEQLKNIYLEHGGGGNHHESYTMPWYFAARKTDIDSIKRGRKGILFTFGDEECPEVLTVAQVRTVIGDTIQSDIATSDLLAMVQQKYDVFHVVVEEGSYAQSARGEVFESWNRALTQGQVIPLADHTKVAEVIVSVIEVHAGKDVDTVVKSWDGSTALVVKNATKALAGSRNTSERRPAVWRPGGK